MVGHGVIPPGPRLDILAPRLVRYVFMFFQYIGASAPADQMGTAPCLGRSVVNLSSSRRQRQNPTVPCIVTLGLKMMWDIVSPMSTEGSPMAIGLVPGYTLPKPPPMRGNCLDLNT